MLFKDIVGHQNLKLKLIQNIKENRISHAQMFTGPEGSGTLPLALAYATYIACEDKSDNDSCGKCSSCIKFSKLIHPDLHFAYPIILTSEKEVSNDYIEEWRRAFLLKPYLNYFDWLKQMSEEVKNALISVDEGLEIIRKLNLKSYEGGYKFMIIWFPEKMNVSTANKILKILEEPPDKTLFLLVSEQPDLLLPTIISRVQKISVPSIEHADMVKFLFERLNIEKENANWIANFSEGNFHQALELLSLSEEDLYFLKHFQEWMRICYARKNQFQLPAWIDKTAALSRETIKEFLAYSLKAIRKNLIRNLQIEPLIKELPEETSFNMKFSNFIHTGNIYEMAEQINKAIADIERNGNSRMILMDVSLQFHNLLNMKKETLA